MEEGIVTNSFHLLLYINYQYCLYENNIYSTHTHIKDRQFNKNITKKVESMGVESVKLRTTTQYKYLIQ